MNLLRIALCAAIIVAAGGCKKKHPAADVERGKKALTAALESWKNGGLPDQLKSLPDPVDFSDELVRTHKLQEFTIGQPDANDPEVIRYPATLKLTDRKGRTEERKVVFMAAMKSPIVIARDPYE